MLKSLLIMRHAKSSWSDPHRTDHERPLNGRGRKSADAIGKALSAKGMAPELIWASDSARTTETAKRLIRIIPGAQGIQYFPNLYHASAETALQIAKGEGEPVGIERLMWLGHNPGWGDLFQYFTGQPHKFPTGACLVLHRKESGNWLLPQSWQVVEFLLPRDIMSS